MDKVILITGASQGLGKVMYRHFSSLVGYKVYGTSRVPGDTELLTLDITSKTSVDNCLEQLITIEGHMDVLINNVGGNIIGSLEGTAIEEFEHQMSLNFYGALYMMKAVMPYFRHAKQGRIINVSSIGARVPLPYNSAYAASKAALEAMSESFSAEIDIPNIFVSLVEPLGLTIEDEIPNIEYIKNEKKRHQGSRQMYNHMKMEVHPSVSKLEVAKAVEKILRSNHPRLMTTVGRGAKLIILAKSLLPYKFFQYLMKRALR